MRTNSHTLEFLPAALEVEQTPPLPASRGILWAIILLFASAVAWACVGQVDIVTTAHGKIVPTGRVKTIQPLETGIVKEIHITEGQRVAVGELLIELEDAKLRADLSRIMQERYATHLDGIKIERQLATLNRYPEPNAYTSQMSTITPLAIENERLKARITSALNRHYASVAVLNAELRQNRAERAALERRIAQLSATIPLVTERAQSLKHLEKQSLAPRVNWLELEERRVQQENEREVIRAQIMMADAAYQGLEWRRNELNAQTRSEWLAELAEINTRLNSFDQEILKATKRVDELRLISPVAGTIQQLAVSTVGGVVTPAEELMLIVPDDGALRIEAWISNKDIGFVREGQAAEIKIETFPFTKYGLIDGELVNVSNDAIADENLGLVYLAQVSMTRSTLWVQDKLVKLAPGMAVTVEVKLGKRRLIEFLLAPLLRYKNEGLKER